MAEAKILYVEDEQFLGKIVKESLESRSFEVRLETDGESALKAFADFRPDVCVLDVMLPRLDGFTLAETIRESGNPVPIIFLTAKSQTEDVVKGFRLGGNDYLRKPFSMEELIVRIENLLRMKKTPARQILTFGGFTLNPQSQSLRGPDGERRLSFRESELLRMLCEKQGEVLDRKIVLLALWQDDSIFNSRSLDVYISRLRQYLKADPSAEIITVKSFGYKLVITQP